MVACDTITHLLEAATVQATLTQLQRPGSSVLGINVSTTPSVSIDTTPSPMQRPSAERTSDSKYVFSGTFDLI
jgi:hypothetical protein